ncbi:MAG: Rieske 2Fe-2S domain-containing protein, partial [Caulobacteraceae bacterium]
MFLKNSWYQAAWSAELTAEDLLARTICGEPLVFFRNPDGAVQALYDRCPHRFAPLSRGTVNEGRLTCGYHGLVFDGSGACVHNPHGPPPRRTVVRPYPAVERHRAIWVWMGDPQAADPSLLPDLAFIDETPEIATISGYMPTRANYELLSDNILDL